MSIHESEEHSGPQSKLSDEDLITVANKNIKTSDEIQKKWRYHAREEYKFVAGDQWKEDDRIQLTEVLGKPDTVFNRVAPIIDAIIGTYINSMTEIQFIPREVGDSQANELLTWAAQWIADENDQEFEEADAAMDLIVCGMGWVEVRMDYIDDPDGMVRIDRRSPLRFSWDPAATKPNIADRRWQAYEDWLTKEDIQDNWPDASDMFIADDYGSLADESMVEIENPEHHYEDHDSNWYSKTKNKYKVITYQWWELEDYYRVGDPATGKIIDFEKSRFMKLKSTFDERGVRYVKQKRKRYFQCFFSGSTLLERGPSPCKSGFTFKCATGKRDEVNNTWYGIVRPMMDPQKWANKYLSQIQHIVATGPKGGVLAETGAFVDIRDAEEKWAAGDSIIELNPGGLEKIKERSQSSYPLGLDKLMEFSISSIRDVTGISLEMLGMREVNQPGILEAQRVQKSVSILGRIFTALRHFKKDIGRVYLEYILDYMTDGRLIRVAGPEGAKYVPLVRQEGTVKYDVIVSEQPNSPNQKEQVWSMLASLLPAILKMGLPIPPSVFDYTPLPAKLANEWKQLMIQATQQGPSPDEQAKTAEVEARTDLHAAKAVGEKVKAAKEFFGPIDGGKSSGGKK